MLSKLIIMRHGEPHADGRLAEKGLTPQGAEGVRSVARDFIKDGLIPNLILCSDALRAQQTLDVIREEYRRSNREITHVRTEPDVGYERKNIPAALSRLENELCVLVITHAYDVIDAVQKLTDQPKWNPGNLKHANAFLLESAERNWRTAIGTMSFKIIQVYKPG